MIDRLIFYIPIEKMTAPAVSVAEYCMYILLWAASDLFINNIFVNANNAFTRRLG